MGAYLFIMELSMTIQVSIKVVDNEKNINVALAERLTSALVSRLLDYIVPVLNRMNQDFSVDMKKKMLLIWQQFDSIESLTNSERILLLSLNNDLSQTISELLELEIKNDKNFMEISERKNKSAQEITTEAIKKAMKR